MKKRIFILTFLNYICMILLLLTVLVLVIKKWHFVRLNKVSYQQKIMADIQHNQTEMSPFLFYASFLAYIHISIYYLVFQVN